MPLRNVLLQLPPLRAAPCDLLLLSLAQVYEMTLLLALGNVGGRETIFAIVSRIHINFFFFSLRVFESLSASFILDGFRILFRLRQFAIGPGFDALPNRCRSLGPASELLGAELVVIDLKVWVLLLVGLRVEYEELRVLLAAATLLKELSLIQQIFKNTPSASVNRLLVLHRAQPSPLVVAELLDQRVSDLPPRPPSR